MHEPATIANPPFAAKHKANVAADDFGEVERKFAFGQALKALETRVKLFQSLPLVASIRSKGWYEHAGQAIEIKT